MMCGCAWTRIGAIPRLARRSKKSSVWIAKFCRRINGFFRSASSRQSEDGTIYDDTTKSGSSYIVPGFLAHKTPRNKMGCDRSEEEKLQYPLGRAAEVDRPGGYGKKQYPQEPEIV